MEADAKRVHNILPNRNSDVTGVKKPQKDLNCNFYLQFDEYLCYDTIYWKKVSSYKKAISENAYDFLLSWLVSKFAEQKVA